MLQLSGTGGNNMVNMMSWDLGEHDSLQDEAYDDKILQMDSIFHQAEDRLDTELASIFGSEDGGDTKEARRTKASSGCYIRRGEDLPAEHKRIVTFGRGEGKTKMIQPDSAFSPADGRSSERSWRSKPAVSILRGVKKDLTLVRHFKNKAEEFSEDRPFDCEFFSCNTSEKSKILDESSASAKVRKVTPDKTVDSLKRRFHGYREPLVQTLNSERKASPPVSGGKTVRKTNKNSKKTPPQHDRLISVLDRPFQYWNKLDTLFCQVFHWTSYQRGRIVVHLIHFLELKLGVDDCVPTGLLLPTPVVEEAWRALVLETTLYRDVVNSLQAFHGKPRGMIHYTFVQNQGLSQNERSDKIRRTQSLFFVYFKESMPVTIEDEPLVPPRGLCVPAMATGGTKLYGHESYQATKRIATTSSDLSDAGEARCKKTEANMNPPSPNSVLNPKMPICVSRGSWSSSSSVRSRDDTTYQASPIGKGRVVDVFWNEYLSPGSASSGASGSSGALSTGGVSDILLGLGMLDL